MSLVKTIKLDCERAIGKKCTIVRFVYFYYIDLGFRAVLWYRIANFLTAKGFTLLPTMIRNRTLSKSGADIVPSARIGAGFVLKHPAGVVIGGRSEIGANCTILQGVTIGENYPNDSSHENPTIGENVTICAGAKVFGRIDVGNNATIGANAVVRESIPRRSTAVGVPARVIASVNSHSTY